MCESDNAVDLIGLLSNSESKDLYESEISDYLKLQESVAKSKSELLETKTLTKAPEQNTRKKSYDISKPKVCKKTDGSSKTYYAAEESRNITYNSGINNNNKYHAKTEQTPSCSYLFEQNLKKIPENDNLSLIREEIEKCQKCSLFKTRKKIVPGEGNVKAKLVFVGEAPGADEDRTGIPFVGRAGRHLDKILKAAGFKREEVFICNILKCRPPNNRTPTLSEMMACTFFLQRQLLIIKPKLIACLGNTAIKYIIGPKTPGITRIHGEWFNSIFNIPTMAMYHPSYLIRNSSRAKGSPNWQMWQDIQKLKKRYDEI